MRIALGCMGMSGAYGETDDAQSTAVIHAAIERGVTFLDTGDFYGSGHNELLIGKAIASSSPVSRTSRTVGVSH
jgi:aryl-alcohol dehydrogenase-like predicted oxidoreductase